MPLSSEGLDPSEQEALQSIGGLSLHEVLLKGQEHLLRRLVARSMAGNITHQEAAILRNLLRDNGMTMATTPMRTIEHQAPQALPSFEKPDYEE